MKNKQSIFLITISLLFCSCTLYGNNKVPYLLEGEITIEESSNYEYAGLNLSLYNKSELDIKGVTVVFYLFDQDGNVPSIGRNNIVLNMELEVAAGKKLDCCIPMDNYLYEIPEYPYQVDYLYLSKIQYTDGSIWVDPFGIAVFK